MADSTYISKNLTADQRKFMKLLDRHEILYFNMTEIESRLQESFSNLNEVLENLVDKEILVRVERGKYALADFHDLNVLATFMARDGMIAYWSALHHHGLTDRFPNTIFVKTIHRKRKTTLFGPAVWFITVHPRKMTGHQYEGYGDKRYPLTDIECTLMDCFDQPKYAGEWADLLRAFFRAEIDVGKLIHYATTYNNLAVIKRMGYLATLTGKAELNPFIDFARHHLGKEFALFDPTGRDEGAYTSNWKLRMNMTEEDIIDTVQSPY